MPMPMIDDFLVCHSVINEPKKVVAFQVDWIFKARKKSIAGSEHLLEIGGNRIRVLSYQKQLMST